MCPRPTYSDEGQFDRSLGNADDPWHAEDSRGSRSPSRDGERDTYAHDNPRHRARDARQQVPPAGEHRVPFMEEHRDALPEWRSEDEAKASGRGTGRSAYGMNLGAGPAPGMRPSRADPRYAEFGVDERRVHEDRAAGPPRRGPKNWKRSDERIRDDLCEQLYHSQHLDAREVSVDVREGLVILEGTVPARHMKYAIEDLAESCPGVTDVDNRLRVLRPLR